MPRCPRTNTRSSTQRKSRVPLRRYTTAEVSFLRAIHSRPCIELQLSPLLFLRFIWDRSPIFILFHEYPSPPPPTDTCMFSWLLCLFLIIYNTRCGSWPHLISATDCITTYRSFITYISALPPSLCPISSILSPIV